MKNYIHPLLCLLLFTQCRKTNTTNNYIVNSNLDAVTIEGLTTIKLVRGHYTRLRLSVIYNAGQHQKVSLAITGLPAEIKTNLAASSTGYPSFSTTILFYDTSSIAPAITGSYEAQLLVTGDSGYSKQLAFRIIVPQVTDSNCAAPYAGIYNFCKVGTVTFADTAEIDPVDKNKIWFRNMANSGKQVSAIIGCNSSDFHIPQQIFGSDTVSGVGNLTLTGYGGYTFVLNVITNGVTKTAYYNLR